MQAIFQKIFDESKNALRISGGTAADIAVTPSGNLAADDVQEALSELSGGRSNTVVIFGDSITAQDSEPAGTTSSADKLFSAKGYWAWCNIMLGQRMKLLDQAGTGGDTTALMLARIATVTAQNPGWCVVQGGGNDVAGGVAASTTTSNLQAIYEALMGAGIKPVATTVLPSTSMDTTAEKQALSTVNRWIKDYCRENPGVLLCDWASVYVDAATGTPLSAYTSDGVHPTNQGAAALGRVLAETLDRVVPYVDILPSAPNDPYNLLTNGFMTGSTSGLATGWTATKLSGAALDGVTSKIARTDGVAGEWQQVALNSTDVQLTGQNTNIGTDFNEGESVYATAEFETDDDFVNIKSFGMRLEFYNGLGSLFSISVASGDGDMPFNPRRGVFRTPVGTVPVGCTRLQLKVVLTTVSNVGSGTFRVGRSEIRKVGT